MPCLWPRVFLERVPSFFHESKQAMLQQLWSLDDHIAYWTEWLIIRRRKVCPSVRYDWMRLMVFVESRRNTKPLASLKAKLHSSLDVPRVIGSWKLMIAISCRMLEWSCCVWQNVSEARIRVDCENHKDQSWRNLPVLIKLNSSPWFSS